MKMEMNYVAPEVEMVEVEVEVGFAGSPTELPGPDIEEPGLN